MAIWDNIAKGSSVGIGKLAEWGKGAWGDITGMGDVDYEGSYLKPEQDPNLAESRRQQASLLGPLNEWALTGKGPSAAQSMVAEERNKNVAQAMGLAKSMPGAGYGAQQAMANQGAATAIGEAATAGAQLRSKEQQAAMGLYAQALDAYRRGDIDTYRAAAQAYADKEKANAEVAAQNASSKRGIIGGIVGGITGGLGL